MRKVLPRDCQIHKDLAEKSLLATIGEKSVFIYAGHCGGEKLWNGTAIQRMSKITANIFLLGCRSAEPYGPILAPFLTPFHYLIGGSGAVAGIMWDVLGRDCDRVGCAVVADVLDGSEMVCVHASLFRGKKICKLPFLTGSSFVVYSPI